MKQKILTVGGGELLAGLEPILSRASVEAVHVPEPEAAVALLAEFPDLELVIVEYPLPTAAINRLLEALARRPPSSYAPRMVLMFPASLAAEVSTYSEQGVLVLGGQQPVERLEAAISGYLRRDPRPSRRLMVRLELRLGPGSILRLAQTRDLSSTGMLVRTTERVPIGTELSFEFELPGVEEPIRGTAEVVRYTVPERERVEGMGVRFKSLEAGGQAALDGFLEQQLEPAE